MLFAPAEPDGRALFESQSDLARVIADGHSVYSGRVAGVRALLQQVLAGKRKFPSELEQSVLAAARKRGSGEGFIAELQQKIETHNSIVVPAARRGGQPMVEPLDQMAALQAHASQVLIFSSLPLELQTDLSETAERLRELALRTFLDDERTSEYTFCVPRRELAVGLWRTWYRAISESSGPEKASATLEEWESKPDLEVQVYVLPEAYCLHPLVVLNMKDKDQSTHAGFIWYTKYDEHAILRIPDAFLNTEWKDTVYTPLRRREIVGQESITWARVRADIERGAT